MKNYLGLLLVATLLIIVESAGENFEILKIENIEKFKKENPDVELTEMDLYVHLDASRSYSLGSRQTGDLVVANGANKQSWRSPQNVTTTLSYPKNGGYGAFLTYVIINCEQSSSLGRAYVINGGVQQHYIQIVVEANATSYFNYSALFYGFAHQKPLFGKGRAKYNF